GVRPEVAWAIRGDRFLTYAARPPEGNPVVAGTWWPEGYRGPPLVSLTQDLAEGFGVTVGDTLTVNVLGRELTARVANLRRVEWNTLAMNFALIFAPGALEDAPHTYLAAAYATPAAEDALLAAVTGGLPNVSAVHLRGVFEGVLGLLDRLGAAFRAMAGVAVVTGFLVLGGAASADQRRRIGEAVIFKVCGATRGDVLRAFGAEFLVVGAAAGGLGLALGTAAAYGVVEYVMNSRFHPSPGAALAVVGLGLAATLALGLVGTARALARRPMAYLRND
ncbi:MAG: ABC transporter permease, partial [Deferrisomatales bacterium]